MSDSSDRIISLQLAVNDLQAQTKIMFHEYQVDCMINEAVRKLEIVLAAEREKLGFRDCQITALKQVNAELEHDLSRFKESELSLVQELSGLPPLCHRHNTGDGEKCPYCMIADYQAKLREYAREAYADMSCGLNAADKVIKWQKRAEGV